MSRGVLWCYNIVYSRYARFVGSKEVERKYSFDDCDAGGLRRGLQEERPLSTVQSTDARRTMLDTKQHHDYGEASTFATVQREERILEEYPARLIYLSCSASG